MIKLVFVHGNIFVYDVEDWSTLRKTHRIVGNIIGSTSCIPSLPLKLLPEEAVLLVEKQLAAIYENTSACSDLPKPSTNLEEPLLEAQQKEYRELRKVQLLALIDTIVEKRRELGDERSKEVILNEEVNKSSTVTKENMIWPIFLKDPIPTLSAVPIDAISSQTTSLRLTIFKDLWERGYYITSGEKFGGHFLVYFGDPTAHHAIFIVKCIDSENTFSPTELISFGRLGVSVRKRAVLASVTNVASALLLNSAFKELHVDVEKHFKYFLEFEKCPLF